MSVSPNYCSEDDTINIGQLPSNLLYQTHLNVFVDYVIKFDNVVLVIQVTIVSTKEKMCEKIRLGAASMTSLLTNVNKDTSLIYLMINPRLELVQFDDFKEHFCSVFINARTCASGTSINAAAGDILQYPTTDMLGCALPDTEAFLLSTAR